MVLISIALLTLSLSARADDGAARREAAQKKIAGLSSALSESQRAAGVDGAAEFSATMFGEQSRGGAPSAQAGGAKAPDEKKTLAAIGTKGAAWLEKNSGALQKAYEAEFERRFQARKKKGEDETKAHDAVFDEMSPISPNVLAWEMKDDYPGASTEDKRGYVERLKKVVALDGVPKSTQLTELSGLIAELGRAK